jgi:alkylation response protein AidB-like acyl-CoA dehydrogenase
VDFALSEEQQEIRTLAAQILGDRSTPELLKEIEAGQDRFDRELWASLAASDLLGLALPESVGGGGYGFTETCLLLEQQGIVLAPVPLWPTLVCGAQPLARWGTDAQQQHYLPGVIAGSTFLTAALQENLAEPRFPATTARRDGDGWVLDGLKTGVPIASEAAVILVPASIVGDAGSVAGGVAVFLVNPDASGVSLERIETMDWEAQFRVELTGVRVAADAVLGSVENGREILDWIVDRATVGLCAIAAGASNKALKITAEYTTNRKQFDRPIATFQAVGQRMADSYIDDQAISVTMWQAATRLDHEKSSDKEVAVAKYWASEGGSRVGHAALHLHGGISIDVDYPIHRYFLWLKQIEFSLGAATPQLAALGAMLAAP